MKTLRRLALRALLVLAGLYALALVLLYVFQRKFFYTPDPSPHTAAELGLPGVRDVVIDTRDGEKLRALYLPPASPGRLAVLYLHGSRGHLPSRAHRVKLLGKEGNGVLLVSYRGYSGSTGSPTQDGLLEDARASYDWLAREAKGSKIVVYGESLGTGIAVKIAGERQVAGVVLDAPYTTVAEAVKHMLPWFPIIAMMKDQYPTVAWIRDMHAPLLILHGDDDDRVPLDESKRVFDLATGPKRFVAIPGADHGDCLENATGEVLSFLRSLE